MHTKQQRLADQQRRDRRDTKHHIQALRDIAMHLSSRIAEMGPFELLSDGSAIPVFAFRVKQGTAYSVFDLSDKLRGKGWQVPAYTMPDNATDIAASASYGITMAYHKDAFAFATADLVMPKGVDFAAREVFDGISRRIIRDYDINNDNFPCRLDILYGFKAVRPELACRGGFN